jgi:hypothetical protein
MGAAVNPPACLDPAVPVAVTFLCTATAVGFVFTWLYLTEGSLKKRWRALWNVKPGS